MPEGTNIARWLSSQIRSHPADNCEWYTDRASKGDRPKPRAPTQYGNRLQLQLEGVFHFRHIGRAILCVKRQTAKNDRLKSAANKVITLADFRHAKFKLRV